MRLAVLIPAPDYPGPWRWAFDIEARALEDAGAAVDPVPWVDAHGLAGYDLIVPLVAWGYHERYREWLGLLDGWDAAGAPLANPASILRWSSDKAYLADLGGRGVPTVPTIVLDALDDDGLAFARDHFSAGELVVKPPVSASAHGTFRIMPGQALPDSARGRPMIVQPLMHAITSEGEYSVMLFGGEFSHAIIKRPAAGDFRVQPHLGGTAEPCSPPEGAIDLALAALAAAPAPTAYARVDVIRGNDGALRLMELELVEPALYLDHAPNTARRRFADAVLSAAG